MEEQVDMEIDIETNNRDLESDVDSENETNNPPQTEARYSMIFTNIPCAPNHNEIVISGHSLTPQSDFIMYRGTQSTHLTDIPCTISLDMPIEIAPGNRVTAEIEDMKATIATISKDKKHRRTRKKEFLVACNNGLIAVHGYDKKHFQLVTNEQGFQRFTSKVNRCYECDGVYTHRITHERSNSHLQAAYFSKLTSPKKDVTISPTEINVFFDASHNVIQKWQVTSDNKTLPLNLYLPTETEKQWISVIFLHATQGLKLTSEQPVALYPNYIQRVEIRCPSMKKGKNMGGIKLEVTRDDTMETLIPILYEIRKEDGHRVFLKQELHVVQGNRQGYILEGLATVDNPPDPRYKRQVSTSQLGKNYLKYPSHHELRLFSPKVLKTLEAITSRNEILDVKLPQMTSKFRLSKEEKELLAINIATLK